jgi:hypothetical protein
MAIRYLSGVNIDSNTLFVDDANNRVGIGTGSPTYVLDVVGSIRSTGNEGKVIINSTAVSGKQYEFISIDTGNLGLYDGTSYRLWVSGAGNVGIGTTSPAGKLHIRGSAASITPSSVGNLLVLEDNENGISILSSTAGAGYLIFGDTADNDVGQIIYDHSANSMNFWANAAERVRITSSGNLYVGATGGARGGSTTKALIKLGSGQYYTELQAYDTSSSVGLLFSDGAGGNYGLIDYTATDEMLLYTASGERMRITAAGNVGIGTTSPAAKLHVNGDVLFTGRLKGAELGNPDITRNGLTFYVDFNDKACHSGTSATEVPIDLSPTGYTMGLYGGANFEYKDGIGSFYFDGNGDIITIGSFNVASTANTYEVWVYMEAISGRWNTFWDSGNERPLIGAYDGVLHAYPNSTGFTMSAGRWYQVVIAFASDDDYDVYVDGKMIVEAADYSGNQRTGTFTGWLGGDLGTETLQGWIGIARYYNRQLTAQEVLQNYNADVRRFATVSTQLGLIQKFGNVGIGTTAPAGPLHIIGGTTIPIIESTSSGANATLQFATTARVWGVGANMALSNSSFEIYDYTAFANRLTILSSGYIGMGTSSPVVPLEVINTGPTLTGTANYVSRFLQDKTNYRGVFLGYDSSSTIGMIGAESAGPASNLAFWTYTGAAWSEKMRITGDGNVGIGTASPSSRLHINTAGSSAFRVTRAGASTYGFEIGGTTFGVYDYTNSVYRWRADGNNVILAESNGNVGIGTTSPSYKLHVYDAATAGNYVAYIQNTSSGNGLKIYNADWDTSDYLLYMSNAGGYYTVVNGNGNVGIGTTTPATKLAIQAASDASLFTIRTSYTGNAAIVDAGQTGADGYLRVKDATGVVYSSLSGYSGTPSYFMTNVGIGTATPGALLDVNGTAYIRTILYTDNIRPYTGDRLTLLNGGNNYVALSGSLNFSTAAAATTTTARIFFGTVPDPAGSLNTSANNFAGYGVDNYGLILQSGYGTADMGGIKITDDGVIIFGASDESLFKVIDEDGNTEHFTINGVGNVGIGSNAPAYKLDVAGTIRATGDVIAYSDARVKENVLTLENSLELVKKLRGVSYNKIGESEKKVGVIAQEVLQVLPEVVSQDQEGTYSVAYGNITAVLIEAIKQQQLQIDELKAEIKQLKG